VPGARNTVILPIWQVARSHLAKLTVLEENELLTMSNPCFAPKDDVPAETQRAAEFARLTDFIESTYGGKKPRP
jgi:hypothetical protein